MKMQRLRVDHDLISPAAFGRIDTQRVDQTTEKEITQQKAADDFEAIQEAARFARRVRKQLGLTQTEFSMRINVPVNTIRNWEQGKRRPTGAAQTLLKMLHHAPEILLAALD